MRHWFDPYRPCCRATLAEAGSEAFRVCGQCGERFERCPHCGDALTPVGYCAACVRPLAQFLSSLGKAGEVGGVSVQLGNAGRARLRIHRCELHVPGLMETPQDDPDAHRWLAPGETVNAAIPELLPQQPGVYEVRAKLVVENETGNRFGFAGAAPLPAVVAVTGGPHVNVQGGLGTGAMIYVNAPSHAASDSPPTTSTWADLPLDHHEPTERAALALDSDGIVTRDTVLTVPHFETGEPQAFPLGDGVVLGRNRPERDPGIHACLRLMPRNTANDEITQAVSGRHWHFTAVAGRLQLTHLGSLPCQVGKSPVHQDQSIPLDLRESVTPVPSIAPNWRFRFDVRITKEQVEQINMVRIR